MIPMKLFGDGYPITSAVALSNNEFKLSGAIMSMSILHSGWQTTFLESNYPQMM